MAFSHVKLECAVPFIKYIAGVFSLIFLPKNLIWNKVKFFASNLQNLLELVVHAPGKTTSKKIINIIFSCDLSLLKVKILESDNWKSK